MNWWFQERRRRREEHKIANATLKWNFLPQALVRDIQRLDRRGSTEEERVLSVLGTCLLPFKGRHDFTLNHWSKMDNRSYDQIPEFTCGTPCLKLYSGQKFRKASVVGNWQLNGQVDWKRNRNASEGRLNTFHILIIAICSLLVCNGSSINHGRLLRPIVRMIIAQWTSRGTSVPYSRVTRLAQWAVIYAQGVPFEQDSADSLSRKAHLITETRRKNGDA